MPPIQNGVLQPLSSLLPPDLVPADLFTTEDGQGSILDRIYVLESTFEASNDGALFAASLAIEGEIAIGLPACPAVSIVLGAGLPGFTLVNARVLLDDAGWSVELEQLKVVLRVDPTVLRPADPSKTFTEIEVETSLRITVDTIELTEDPTLTLPRSFIGDTGIAVSAGTVKFDFRRDASIPEATAAGLADSWMGLYVKDAAIEFPPDLSLPLPQALKFQDCFIGGGGFTGAVSLEWTPGTVAGTLFGFGFDLHSVALRLRESAFEQAAIAGVLSNIPFFDKPACVEVSFGAGGQLSVSLAAEQASPAATSPEGLLRLEIPNVATFDVAALEFSHQDAKTVLSLSGKVTPLLQVGGRTWPSLEVKRLSVDSDGRVQLEGGWIDLPDQYSVKLGPFALELSRIGFGRVEGSPTDRWFGLTGAIHLTEFLPAGASVDGLRIVFGPGHAPQVSFEGIGLEFGVPDVFRFAGHVAYREDNGSVEFRGSASLELYALDASIDVQIVIGHNGAPSFHYAYLYLDAKLVPSGIPIFNTGLSLYGFAGLYAQNMAPALTTGLPDSEKWYEWFRRNPMGVTDQAKWAKQQGDMAVGLGVTLGTADAGFTFNAKALVVLLLPQPVLMLDGKANLVKLPPPQTSTEEAAFHAFALYDSRGGIIELAVDADYHIPALLDAHADARAHFEVVDPSQWFVALGEETPPERRVTASLFKGLLDGWMFLRIDPARIRTGFGIELHKRLEAGPAWMQVDASAQVIAQLAYLPPQFEATGHLEGSAEAGIKGVSIGVSVGVDAELAAPKPFLIKASFRACVKILIKRFCVTFPFELSDDQAPPVEGALAAVAIRHPCPPTQSTGAPPPSSWPREIGGARMIGIPCDGVIALTFRRQVRNDTGAFIQGDARGDPWQAVGERTGYRYQYRLAAVRLYDETNPNAPTAAPVSGAWQVAAGPTTVLELGAQTAFDGSSGSITSFPFYNESLLPPPCEGTPAGTVWVCKEVEMPASEAKARGLTPRRQSERGTRMAASMARTHRETRAAPAPGKASRQEPVDPECEPRQRHTLRELARLAVRDPRLRLPLLALGLLLVAAFAAPRLREQAPLLIFLALLAAILYFGLLIVAERIMDEAAFLYCGKGCACRGYGPTDPHGTTNGTPDGTSTDGKPTDGTSTDGTPEGHQDPPGGTPDEHDGEGTVVVVVCHPETAASTPETSDERETRLTLWEKETSAWSQKQPILRPNTNYRLEVDWVAELRKNDTVVSTQPTTSKAWFKTAGPPSDAGALEPYVQWTVPASAPGATGNRRAYRGYDIGVLFRKSYVDVMYVANGDDLELRLLDNNGDPLRDAQGNDLVLPNQWSQGPTPVLTREQYVMTQRVAKGGCLPTTSFALQPLATAAPSSVGLLRPETYHEVHVTRRNDPTKAVLARFSFVTSRFESFRAMALSFLPAAAVAKDGAGLAGANLGSDGFDALAQALGLLPSERPERLAVRPLRRNGQTHAFLLDAPEPIEWRRTQVAAKVVTGQATLRPTLRVVANADETLAILVPLDASGNPQALPDGACELTLAFTRLLDAAQPIYAMQGDTTLETATLAFPLEAAP
jgi:hypothetical protein